MVNQERLNGSVSETVVNTQATSSIEVPNSQGKKLVFLDLVELDALPPQIVAATVTTVEAVCVAGKSTPTTPTLDQSGAVAARVIKIYPQAGAAVVQAVYSAGEEAMDSPVQLFPAVDGKYYVTIAVKGTANAATLMTVRYHCRFRVA
jgi:hypothetical protein